VILPKFGGGLFVADLDDFLVRERRNQTPEETTRSKWAHDVREKILSCEVAQWLPIVKASAVRRERISLVAVALLPPLLLLTGAGLTRRATKTISAVAAKLLATAGALGIAVVIAVFVDDIGGRFYDFVLRSDIEFHFSGFWKGLRPDVFCALLIPFGIVLWGQWSAPLSKRIEACCAGIAAGFVPIMVQVITWPFIFYRSSDSAWAVAVMAVVAAVVLSVSVTKHLLTTDLGARPFVPPHIRTGLIRLYLVLTIPWLIWNGYAAYKAYNSLTFDYSIREDFVRLSATLDESLRDPKTPATRIAEVRRELGVMASTWDANTIDEIEKRIEESIDHNTRSFTFAIYAILGAVTAPLLYPIFLWILAGFRKSSRTRIQPGRGA
jgi:hypothetical protein